VSDEDRNIMVVQKCATAVLVPPGAVIIRCARCNEECWLSKGGQADMAEHDLDTVCVECTYGGILSGSIDAKADETTLSANVREELLSLGLSEKDIQGTVDKARDLAILAAFEGIRRKLG
jgi:LSD1 subclass zinc finger protein